MTRREQALTIIKAQVARDGQASLQSIRLYVENRIGYETFLKAVNAGRQIYLTSASVISTQGGILA